MSLNLHPSINGGLKAGSASFKGGTLACQCADHKVKVWSFDLGEQQRTIDVGLKEVTAVTYAGGKHQHVTRLYERVKLRKGHSVAVGAVARHLAEATFWILNKQEPYREPTRQKVLPKQA